VHQVPIGRQTFDEMLGSDQVESNLG